MQQVRPNPFDLVFEPLAQTAFPRIQSALAESGQDPLDRDAFLMLRDVVTLLRELRPDEGLGEGIDQLAALVHHGYLFWAGGKRSVEIPDGLLDEMMREGNEIGRGESAMPPHYIVMPHRRVWASVIPGEAPEPLEGFFEYGRAPSSLHVLGVFGIHPERAGLSVVEVAGTRPLKLTRTDESPLFAPTLAGGAAAGIYSLSGGEELLELGWRAFAIAALAESDRWKA